MQLPTVLLDASMQVSVVLARLARHGLWLRPGQPDARRWIDEVGARLNLTREFVTERLGRSPAAYGVAIRRQWGINVLWYGMSAKRVLLACHQAPDKQTLLDVLNLHEHQSEIPQRIERSQFAAAGSGGLVTDGVSLAYDDEIAPDRAGRDTAPFHTGADDLLFGAPGPSRSRDRSSDGQSGAPPVPQRVSGWPAIDAPKIVRAAVPFEVAVGLAAERVAGVAGERMDLPVPAGAAQLQLTVQLTTAGLDTLNGWSQPLEIDVANPTLARAIFRLVAQPPDGPEGIRLSSIEVRYLLGGVVCGTASCPLVTYRVDATAPPAMPLGMTWTDRPSTSTPITLSDPALAPDLTIEISHPDADATRGVYACRLSTPHLVPIDTDPHKIDLGDDAKTFARTIVDQVRLFAGDNLTNSLVEAVGDLVATKLPSAVFNAIAAVAEHVNPRVPAVLLVSAEPYVPWELAAMPALDPSRPPCLGAQVAMGRWWREGPNAGGPSGRIRRPAANPPECIDVGAMAVMVGKYKAEAGLRALPEAEKEAKELVSSWQDVAMPASSAALIELLNARVVNGFDEVGAIDAMHFAGHGDFDATRPDGAMMFLSDGRPLSSLLFRSAKYGETHKPLAFFNACMIGIGGELLGDAGGFPGNCLRGGFGGVLGALWEVDDALAREISLEFWQRAMPAPGGKGEPIGEIWRDLRARYSSTDGTPPHTTYLSYVFYGHPRLTLGRH
jgi:hypothetical protein